MKTHEQYRTADPKSLQVKTPRLEVRVGIPVGILGSPRDDLRGRRVKVPGDPRIYLIDKFTPETAGYRRHIPDPPTFNNLFRDWDGIIEDDFVDSIPVDYPLPQGAVLVRGIGNPAVYLIDYGKRWVSDPSWMDRYHFEWGNVVEVPPILLDRILEGLAIR